MAFRAGLHKSVGIDYHSKVEEPWPKVASICLMLVQIAIAFVPASATVWTYAVLRMLSGCFAIGGGGTGFVYTMEIVGVKWRTWLGAGIHWLAFRTVPHPTSKWNCEFLNRSSLPNNVCIWILLAISYWIARQLETNDDRTCSNANFLYSQGSTDWLS